MLHGTAWRTVLGLLIVVSSCAPAVAQAPGGEAIYLAQGWTQADRQKWYTTSQGSRLLPLAWMRALEQAGSTEKFLSEANVARLGYLQNPAANDGLPLGFAIDAGASPDGSTQPWAGMTCAACHTGEITFQGKRMHISGGPTLADFQTFMEDMLASLRATLAQPDKFDRFAAAVLQGAATPAEKAKLQTELDGSTLWYMRLAEKNDTPLRYGRGRIDAQGHILNKLSLIVGVDQQIRGIPSDAPASYPFLWNTPQHDLVQWNGIAPQKQFDLIFDGRPYDAGAMARNTTEVSGVFASIDTTPPQQYPTSLRFKGMLDLEDLVRTLKSPRWPETILPPILADGAERGRVLYEDRCSTCHTVLDPATELQANITIKMQPLREIGTDVWLACNTFLHTSLSGRLEGRFDRPFGGNPIPGTAPTIMLLANIGIDMAVFPPTVTSNRSLTGGIYGLRPGQMPMLLPPGATPRYDDPEREARYRTCLAASADPEARKILAYKPRPLNGIWATAPYLHNGSVPTLFDLLLPENQRPQTFTTGGKDFDPVKVGFKSAAGDGPFEFRVRDAAGKLIPGNENSGHDHGADLTDEQRLDLVEYLKRL